MMKHGSWVGSMSDLKPHTELIFVLTNINDFEFNIIFKSLTKGLICKYIVCNKSASRGKQKYTEPRLIKVKLTFL